jgi:hypothetical protein
MSYWNGSNWTGTNWDANNWFGPNGGGSHFSYIGTGGIVFAGAATTSFTPAYIGSGGLAFGGTAATAFVPNPTPPLIPLRGGGGGWSLRRKTRQVFRRKFIATPSGGLLFQGEAESLFISSPRPKRRRKRQEESVLVSHLAGMY